MDGVLRYRASRPRDFSRAATESIVARDTKTRKKIPGSALANLSSLEQAAAMTRANAHDRRRIMFAREERLDRRRELIVKELLHELATLPGAHEEAIAA